MASLVSRLFLRKQITQPVTQKMLVVEKNNVLTSGAISAGSTVAKLGVATTVLSTVGYKVQQLKGELFQDLLGNNPLGNLGDSISDKFDSVKNDIGYGLIIVGGFVVIGLILKQSF